MSPGRTSSAGTVRSSPSTPPTRITALSGEDANRSTVARRARSRLRASRWFASAKRVTTTDASAHSPSSVAPPMEMAIKAFIPSDRFRTSLNPRSATGAPPRRIDARKGRRASGSPGKKAAREIPRRRAAPARRNVLRCPRFSGGRSAFRSASSTGCPSMPIRRNASRTGSTGPVCRTSTWREKRRNVSDSTDGRRARATRISRSSSGQSIAGTKTTVVTVSPEGFILQRAGEASGAFATRMIFSSE